MPRDYVREAKHLYDRAEKEADPRAAGRMLQQAKVALLISQAERDERIDLQNQELIEIQRQAVAAHPQLLNVIERAAGLPVTLLERKDSEALRDPRDEDPAGGH